jgi:hypothetical protein
MGIVKIIVGNMVPADLFGLNLSELNLKNCSTVNEGWSRLLIIGSLAREGGGATALGHARD